MGETLVIVDSISDLTLKCAEQIGFDGASLSLGAQAEQQIRMGRAAFENLTALGEKEYIYGVTTQPGGRAKQVADETLQRRRGASLSLFIAMDFGFSDSLLPERTVRMIALARLSNALAGRSRLTFETAKAIADILDGPIPAVPLASATGPGEVIPLSWFLSPLASLPLKDGEAMSLINGSPCSTAMVCEAAIASRRIFDVLLDLSGLMIEAARAPLMHYDRRLSDLSQDQDFRHVLVRLEQVLDGAEPSGRLAHQAPVSWRIIPNILATSLKATKLAEEVAETSLQSVNDNPAMVGRLDDPQDLAMVSAGGFHAAAASRAIDQINAALADLTVLLSKQTARLVDGHPFGFPPYLCPSNAYGVGGEYLAWLQSGASERARHAAAPATLSPGLEDPDGGQSDVSATTFLAYERNMHARDALYSAMSTAIATAELAMKIHGQSAAPDVERFRARFDPIAGYADGLATMGQSLRSAKCRLRSWIEGGSGEV